MDREPEHHWGKSGSAGVTACHLLARPSLSRTLAACSISNPRLRRRILLWSHRGGGEKGGNEGKMETQVQSHCSAKSLEKNLSPISLFKNFLIKPFVFAVISSSCRPSIFQALSHPSPCGSGELHWCVRTAEGDHTLCGFYCSHEGRFLGLFFRLFH